MKGGKAGRPFQVTIDPGGPNEREVDALADAEPVKEGEVIRIRTTGGGGWGDPLDRDAALVERDVRWRKVSVTGAREDYGVVLTHDGERVVVDDPATRRLRGELRSRRTGDESFFDRGPGYVRLSGNGAADVDFR